MLRAKSFFCCCLKEGDVEDPENFEPVGNSAHVHFEKYYLDKVTIS